MAETISKGVNPFPEFLNSRDLVDLGLYPSESAVNSARLKGNTPDFIQFGKKILYPKSCVIQFIESHLKRGRIPKSQREGDEPC